MFVYKICFNKSSNKSLFKKFLKHPFLFLVHQPSLQSVDPLKREVGVGVRNVYLKSDRDNFWHALFGFTFASGSPTSPSPCNFDEQQLGCG